MAITFDDGPNPSITPTFLDLLARYDARATFFLIGRYARECPELVREVAARGHVVGNHTQTHVNLFRTGPAGTREELRRCQDSIAWALATAGGAAPVWFRPPWGLRSPWLGTAARELRTAGRDVVVAAGGLARAERSVASGALGGDCGTRRSEGGWRVAQRVRPQRAAPATSFAFTTVATTVKMPIGRTRFARSSIGCLGGVTSGWNLLQLRKR